MEEEKIYVAISKDFKEDKSTLLWALQNSGGKRVCIIHVHQPDKRIPSPIGHLPVESVDEAQLIAHRQKEKQEMSSILDEYLQIALKAGVTIEKSHIEDDCIEKGIIKLIEQQKIGKLVMGAAADKHYHPRKMTELRSQKAIYVRQHAPPSCHILFVCKGFLIYTRKATTAASSSASEIEAVANYFVQGSGVTAPTVPYNVPEWIQVIRQGVQRWSIDTDVSGPASSPNYYPGRESVEILSGRESITGESPGSTPPHRLAFHQSVAQRNEIAQGTRLEKLYIEECKRRIEVEAELAKVKEELEWMKKSHVAAELPKVSEELDYMRSQVAELVKVKAEFEHMKTDVLGELRSAFEQKILLENQIGNSNFLLQMLGEKLASTIELVHSCGEQ